MNNYFVKNQLLIAFVLAIYSAYLINEYINNVESINHKNKKEITITEKNCGVGNGAYSISFLYQDKRYNTKILGKPCLDLNIGDNYELYYSDKNDEFLDHQSVEHSLKGVIASIVIFVLFLFPYKVLKRNRSR